MKIEKMTKDIAYEELQKFFMGETPFVLFGTGTSCALDTAFGMEALQKHLESEINNNSISCEEKTEWDTVLDKLKADIDLETAMDSIKKESLIDKVVKHTAQLVGTKDKEYSYKILSGQSTWPAISLLSCIVDGCSKELHVATTNYDLLAEYAFEKAKIPYINGFSGGVCRYLDWSEACSCIAYLDKVPKGQRWIINPKFKKHICLYKVHGSLNTFKIGSKLIENNAWMYDPPSEVSRVMITPGTSKYERLHLDRHELLGSYDQALENHNRFLFLGFGFNDNQLNNDSIKRKLKDQHCFGLIITRDCNQRIESLLSECENLWLVCKNDDKDKNGTRILNQKYKNPLYLENKKLWDLDEFTNEILGG